VLDAFSRRIVGWSIRDDLKSELVVDALALAVTRRKPTPPASCITATAARSTSLAFGTTLRESGLVASMGHRGDAYDNAACESVISTIKNELVKRRSWTSRDQARLAVFSYIETFYNPRRRHSARSQLDIPPGRVDKAREQPGAKDGELDRDRLGETPGTGVWVVVPERGRVGLDEAEAGEDVFDAPLEPLQGGERAEHRAASGKREGNLVHPEAGDLFDHVDLARDVAGAPGGRDHVVVTAFEAEPPQERVLLLRGRRQPDHLVRALRPIADHGPLRQITDDVGMADPACPGGFDEQLRRQPRRPSDGSL